MRRALIVLALLWAGSVGEAQQTCAGYGNIQVFPFAYEAMSVSSTAVGFTAGTFDNGVKKALMAVGTLEDDSIRFTVDGTTPTSTVGQLVTQASNVSITVCGEKAIRAFRAIRTSTDASLKVVFYAGTP